MNILAIETSSNACSIALKVNDKINFLHKIIPMQQAQNLLPMLDDVIKESNISLQEVDAIAFGCGPGSFTGVRIAISVAKGLAFALNKPLIAISSLQVLAQTAYDELQFDKVLTAVDARMNEVYFAKYELNTNGIMCLINEEQFGPPEDYIKTNDQEFYGVGTGFNEYKDLIEVAAKKVNHEIYPNAKSMLKIAELKLSKNEIVSAEDAMPSYLRNKVAKKS